MNFVKIELRGFKSFADKVEIPFKEGVTAIIGPNGCGKSNVADAIRWTLGEQSAKSLRGKSMQDVIFAGTEKRKSMSYCEVSLQFNNDGQKIFPSLPFDDVIITRKLDRSGLSEYYINQTRCRMKDIINLFHDTGIGKEGYSIIGQGRIEEILSAKPDDRRNIFEEAAGISKFRAQRTEAERKLEKTAQNLQTASEIISEIERQLNPLRKQAETAQKYFEIKDQLKKNEVNLYIYNFENNQTIKQKIYDRLDVAKKDLKVKEMQLSECGQKYDKCLTELSGIDRVYEQDTSELLSLKVDVEKMAGEENLLKEKISNLKNEQVRLNDELKDLDMRLSISSDLIKRNEDKKEDQLKTMLALSRELEEASSKCDSLTKTLEGQASDIETSNSEYIKAVEELGDLKTNLQGYVAEKGINEERAKTLLNMLNGKKARLDEELTNLTIYDSNVKSAREKLRDLLSSYNECMSEKADANEAIKGIVEDINTLNSKLSMHEANLKLYISIKNEYQGYQEAVKRLMRDAQNDPTLNNKIIGVLAELITVPEGYETAIEYSLGGALQNIIVDTERDASDLIAYLKQKSYGRVTFRPLTTCRPHVLTGESRDVLKEQGCFGVASDLINYEKNIDDVIQTLLGSTVVVDNINTAIRLFKKYNQAFKVVTLDGDIFSRGGEITGGSRRSQNSGLLSQEKQIEQAKENIERTKTNMSRLLSQKQEREQELVDCEEKINSFNQDINELKINLSLNEEKSKQSVKSTETLQIEIAKDAEEYEIAHSLVLDLSVKIGSIDELEKIVKSKQTQYNDLLANSKTKNNIQKNEKDILQEKVMELRVKVAESKSQINGTEAEIFRLRREEAEFEEEKLDLIADLKNVENNIQIIENAPEKKVFSKEDLARINRLEQEISSLSERKKFLNEEIKNLDAQRSDFNESKTTIEGKIIRDESMLENVDIEIRHMQEHILEEYDLTYSGALEFKDSEFKAYGAQTVIADLKKAISKLGEVNPLAIETLKETEERHTECITQRDDIQTAYDDIQKIIAELTGEMVNKFTDAFDKININFQEVFKQLFGGGKGELRLNMQETDDPLEAGIDIFSQPPGKKLQNINLLSGGEKALTAISILFAILKLKPMPFCVLDEIEAALDDANANLFADFLKKFSTDTQFIVITHRKPTMRHADSIFGVTMEEKGVTKIVSIEFEEAIKHASSDN